MTFSIAFWLTAQPKWLDADTRLKKPTNFISLAKLAEICKVKRIFGTHPTSYHKKSFIITVMAFDEMKKMEEKALFANLKDSEWRKF